MAPSAHVLVIARQTADSDDLVAAARARAERSPADFTLLLPAPKPGLAARDEARPSLEAAVAKFREAGLEATGEVGDHDPLEACVEICAPGRFDEVIVATLPGAHSKWLQVDLPHRIARLTDLPVTHVIAKPPGWAEHRTGPPPQHEREPLGPLGVMAWSRGRA
jgi:hypothetical protein